ncbi:MAG: hypothetical protein IKK57_07570 [Clostridia bacterium]|nr:hypothetical protein [Clostridia bacterium]
MVNIRKLLAVVLAMLLLTLPVLAEEAERQAAANEAYAGVLLDGAAITPGEGDMHMPADWNVVRFALVDLNEDGVDECILELAEYEAFIILFAYNDGVWAWEWSYRGMNKLKDDGTFSFSSGALDNGVGQLTLRATAEGDQWGILPLAESISCQDEAGNVIVTYWLDGGAESTDEAGFLAALEAQDAKLDALWYDYTPENLQMLLRH